MLLLHVLYLDDEIIIGDLEKVVKAMDIIQEMGQRLGFEMDIYKTEIF